METTIDHDTHMSVPDPLRWIVVKIAGISAMLYVCRVAYGKNDQSETKGDNDTMKAPTTSSATLIQRQLPYSRPTIAALDLADCGCHLPPHAC